MLEALLLDVHGVDVDVTESTVKFKGKQSPGGVKKKLNATVKFEGVIASGEGQGNRVKGKVKTKDKFE